MTIYDTNLIEFVLDGYYLLEDRETRRQDLKKKRDLGYLKVTDADIETALDISEPYAHWILIQVTKGTIKFPQDKDFITQLLKDFDFVKKSSRFTGFKDIYAYKTLQDLKAQVEKSKTLEISKGEQKRRATKEGQRVVAKDPSYTVIEITTPEASAELLRGTEWCVKDPDYFADYIEYGPVYLVLKNDKKFLCYSDYDGFSDMEDHPVKRVDKKLLGIFIKLGTKVLRFVSASSLDLSLEQYVSFLKDRGVKATIRDGKIDVEGDIFAEYVYYKGSEIVYPFGKVSGNFSVEGLPLRTLKNSPEYVGDDFNCSVFDKLITLEGAPERVEGTFDCSYCDGLTSLEGAPEYVGRMFNCSQCHGLTSLKGAPRRVEVFWCSGCENLKSLEGAPEHVGRDFDCSYCDSLTSLKGAPRRVEVFKCYSCKNLISLEGAPDYVSGDFNCSYCYNLTSLAGAPKYVGRNFNCFRCENLTSLKGVPKRVGRDFKCFYCRSLTSLEGAPEYVGKFFDCSYCDSLTSLKGAPEYVGGDFYCAYCSKLTSLQGLKEVKGIIYAEGTPIKDLAGFPEDKVYFGTK